MIFALFVFEKKKTARLRNSLIGLLISTFFVVSEMFILWRALSRNCLFQSAGEMKKWKIFGFGSKINGTQKILRRLWIQAHCKRRKKKSAGICFSGGNGASKTPLFWQILIYESIKVAKVLWIERYRFGVLEVWKKCKIHIRWCLCWRDFYVKRKKQITNRV